jgi:hypothetical protein
MIYGIKRIAKYLLGIDIAGRNLAVYADDVFIVSYPRSGNTWTRFLVANLIHPEVKATFLNIERLVPDSEAQSSRFLKRVARPRVIKSHQYFDHRYKKVVYIVRDPRDIALSYYDFQRKYRQIEDGYPLIRYVNDFVSGRLISADYGTWGANVASWISTRGTSSDFLLLRYEDMLNDTLSELRRLATFLEIKADQGWLEQIVENCSARHMRELEKTEGDRWVSTRNRRKDIPFVRAAASGGWRTSLPPESVAEIEAAWGDIMMNIGYPLVTRAAKTNSRTRLALTIPL